MHKVLISTMDTFYSGHDIMLIDGLAHQASRSGAGKVRVSRSDRILMLGGHSPGKELTSPGSVVSLGQARLEVEGRGKRY